MLKIIAKIPKTVFNDSLLFAKPLVNIGIVSFPLRERNLSTVDVTLTTLTLEDKLQEKFKNVHPQLPVHSFTLAPFVNNSETLKALLSFGVDLKKLETDVKLAESVAKKNYEELQSVLDFIQSNGVQLDLIGQVINRYPKILINDLCSMEARLELLKSLGVPQTTIANMICRAPKFLDQTAEQILSRFKFLESELDMPISELIPVLSKCPRLLSFETEKIRQSVFSLKELAGFTNADISIIATKAPRILTIGRSNLLVVHDFLRHVMELSNAQIVNFPQIYRSRVRRIKQRHEFLVKLNRNQYNPRKANFVSLRDLVAFSDEKFATEIAKSSLENFDNFLKS